MKGETTAKRSSLGSIMRKRLSDITNSQAQAKLVNLQEEKETQLSHCTEDLINKLLKEKAALTKLIEERNKIIELSGLELRNMRMNYQKLQLQNWNLAQSNSQILAELNLGRDKMKSLQHELACKESLLKAKNLESQEGEKVTGECSQKRNSDVKSCNRIKRRTSRSKSMGASSTQRQSSEKDKIENKRRCLRRQSARSKSQGNGPAENLFEIEDAKFLVIHPLNQEAIPTSATKVETYESRKEAQEAISHRSSMGRPLRRAAEKVHSYKEVPVNVKMRRVG